MNDIAADDASRLRILRSASDLDSTRPLGDCAIGAPCRVGKVLTSAGPASPGFFKCEAYDLTGAEVEGGAGTLTDAGYFFLAMNLGTSIPPATTPILFHFVPYRWAFRYDG